MTDDPNALSDAAFRQIVRDWIAANYPAELRNPPRRLHRAQTKIWYDRLAAQGWLCPGWPREFGGMG